MKTTVIRNAFIAMVIFVGSVFSASAQDIFFDKKYENGKVISKTKYELGYSGLHEKTYKTEYIYNEWGQLKKEETFKWNNKKSVWVPDCYTNHTYSIIDNSHSLEYAVWNKKENRYNDASEKATYWMDEFGNVISWNFHKNGEKSFEETTMVDYQYIKYFCM